MSVPVILPLDWIARLNLLATTRGVSRSALIREAIACSYSADLQPPVLDTMPASSGRKREQRNAKEQITMKQ
jgi:Ribbon-helix-helix protein, copG family